MKVQLFEILFDDAPGNPHAVYSSGQTVGFRVHLKLLEPVKCRAIYVKLYGSAYVHWTETKSRGSGKTRYTEVKHYQSEEIYIDQKVAIYTPETIGPNAEHHPAGEFFYPITFQIPHTAPSSYEGGIGRIRYSIKANIDRPWKFDNYTQRFYTVIREMNLNYKTAAEVGPFSTENEFDVNCCLCFNCCFGKVRVRVALPKKGYVPGELVPVTGEIQNTSSTDLNSANLEIYQRTQFHAQGKTNTNTRVVSSVEVPGAPKGETIRLNHLIPVNPVPNSHIEGCSNIEVFYYFRIKADGGCCLSMTEECCELLIGTVPLWSSFVPPSVPGGAQGGYDGPLTERAPPYPNPSSDAVPPPPSYEECTFGRVEIDKEAGKNVSGVTQWAPSYPVYAFASAPPAAQPSTDF